MSFTAYLVIAVVLAKKLSAGLTFVVFNQPAKSKAMMTLLRRLNNKLLKGPDTLT